MCAAAGSSLSATAPPAGGPVQGRGVQWLLLGGIVLLAGAILIPPLVNVGRYQHRIAESLGSSIGRPVHMSAVKLRLLPRPGFVISNLSIEERPEFGAEPILHAASVVAYVRLWSLWRGRLEVASIYFDDASLNVVHLPNGAWNFASILVQAAHTPNAPTQQRHAGAEARFPYIEATSARINFKQGDEKTPLSFLNADLAIWLADANQWQLRFEARPVRTDLDLHLADTGVLRIGGTLRRAPSLAQMPLKLEAEWTGAPLGQLSRLTLGDDLGWRGDLDVRAAITGSAELAHITTRVQANGVRRAEFVPPQTLNLASTCDAAYHKANGSLEDIACTSRVDAGRLVLTGAIDDIPTDPRPRLSLEIAEVPAAAVIAALQQVRPNFARGLEVAGSLNGRFSYAGVGGAAPTLTGEAEVDALSIHGSGLASALEPVADAVHAGPRANRATAMRLVCGPAMPLPVRPAKAAGAGANAVAFGAAGAFVWPVLQIEPVRFAFGTSAPLLLEGRLSDTGFDLHLLGAGTLNRLRGLSQAFGVLTAMFTHVGGTGTADVDLRVTGPWLAAIGDQPVTNTRTEGTLSLRNVEFAPPYLARPLKIVTAQAFLGGEQTAWNNLNISYAGQQARGRVEYPSDCSAQDCTVQFALSCAGLDLTALQSGLGGGGGREILRRVFSGIASPPTPWPHAIGSVQVAELSAGKLALRNAAATLDVSDRSMDIRSLDAQTMGGTMHLTGSLNMASGEPHYRIDTQLTGASPSHLAALFGERWGGGTANVSLHLQTAGFTAADLAGSASGSVRWVWSDGALPAEQGEAGTATPSGSSAVPVLSRFDRWTADATFADSTLRVGSLLTRGEETVPVTGTISFQRELDLKSTSEGNAFSATGTLEHPQIVETAQPENQASTPSTP